MPARREDVEAVLAPGLREQDVQELAALGLTPAVLRDSWEVSAPHRFVIKADSEPVGIFGARAYPGTNQLHGIPWMLGNDGLYSIARDLVVQSPIWVSYLNEVYPVLVNWIDVRNTVSRRWLEHAGFKFDHQDSTPMGGTEFIRFYRLGD